MRNLLLIFTLLFSTVISSSSYAKWTALSENNGSINGVDFERIKKQNGFVYYWELINHSKPFKGISSGKMYNQGDCKQFRYKILSYYFYKEPMGIGEPNDIGSPKNPEWIYSPPNSVVENTLKKVCSR